MSECVILLVLQTGEINKNNKDRLWVAKEEICNANGNAETE